MGRIVTDITHYFNKHDVDILSAKAKRDLIADNLVPLLNAMSVRENYLVDLIYELLVNEAYVDALQAIIDKNRRDGRCGDVSQRGTQ